MYIRQLRILGGSGQTNGSDQSCPTQSAVYKYPRYLFDVPSSCHDGNSMENGGLTYGMDISERHSYDTNH